MATRHHAFTIRIAILDDHPIVRWGMQNFLSMEKDLELTGSFGQSTELLAALRESCPDVLLLDYMLEEGEIDGLALIRNLMTRYPRLKILLTSSLESPAVIRMAMKAGIKGFVGKSEHPQTIVKAIRYVAQGKIFLTDMLDWEMQDTRKEIGEPSGTSLAVAALSARESEVLRCFLDGMSVGEIALKYKRSRKTISGQKQSALRKLSIKTDAELFRYRESLFTQP